MWQETADTNKLHFSFRESSRKTLGNSRRLFTEERFFVKAWRLRGLPLGLISRDIVGHVSDSIKLVGYTRWQGRHWPQHASQHNRASAHYSDRQQSEAVRRVKNTHLQSIAKVHHFEMGQGYFEHNLHLVPALHRHHRSPGGTPLLVAHHYLFHLVMAHHHRHYFLLVWRCWCHYSVLTHLFDDAQWPTHGQDTSTPPISPQTLLDPKLTKKLPTHHRHLLKFCNGHPQSCDLLAGMGRLTYLSMGRSLRRLSGLSPQWPVGNALEHSPRHTSRFSNNPLRQRCDGMGNAFYHRCCKCSSPGWLCCSFPCAKRRRTQFSLLVQWGSLQTLTRKVRLLPMLPQSEWGTC